MGGKSRPRDFMPDFDKQEQTAEEMILVAKSFAAAYGRVVSGDNR